MPNYGGNSYSSQHNAHHQFIELGLGNYKQWRIRYHRAYGEQALPNCLLRGERGGPLEGDHWTSREEQKGTGGGGGRERGYKHNYLHGSTIDLHILTVYYLVVLEQ